MCSSTFSAGNRHDGFEVAGAGTQLTVRLMRHSQRKRGATEQQIGGTYGVWRLPSTQPGVPIAALFGSIRVWLKLLSAEKMIWRSSAFCKSPISPGHRTEDASRVGPHLEGNCALAIRRCT